MGKITDLLNIFKPLNSLILSPARTLEDPTPVSTIPNREALIQEFEDDVLQYVGMTELGGNTNRAEYIDNFNCTVGVPAGSPYCMTAIQTTRRKLEKNHDIQFDLPFVGGTQNFWTQTKAIYKFNEPAKGRLAVFKSALDSSKGHVGTCLSGPLEGGVFNTFEFNTSGNGSRNGLFQMRKTRKLGCNGSLILLGFVDYSIAYKPKTNV